MNRGYIKLWRMIEDFDWYKNPIVMSLWIHILLKTNHEDKKWQGENIKRGSFITGLSKLSYETGLTVQQIRTALKKLELTNNITSKSTNKYRVITVTNYDKYQNSNKQIDKQLTTEQQATNNQSTATNNNKELNHLNELKESSKKTKQKKFVKPTYEDIDLFCKENDLKIDIQYFIDYYESNGWKVGKNNMKDWQATVRNWNRRNKTTKEFDTSDFDSL